MKKCFNRIFVALLFLAFVASPALAEKWVQLGERTVTFKADTDEITVGSYEGRFKRIKLKVEEAGVHFNEVMVVFGNGQTFDVKVRDNIPAGGQTRAIDLPGEARKITKIILKYKTRAGSDEKAIVRVLGYQD